MISCVYVATKTQDINKHAFPSTIITRWKLDYLLARKVVINYIAIKKTLPTKWRTQWGVSGCIAHHGAIDMRV
jgi:hypothetical protein